MYFSRKNRLGALRRFGFTAPSFFPRKGYGWIHPENFPKFPEFGVHSNHHFPYAKAKYYNANLVLFFIVLTTFHSSFINFVRDNQIFSQRQGVTYSRKN